MSAVTASPLLERLREEWRQLAAADERVFIPVGGAYRDPELLIQYRLLDVSELPAARRTAGAAIETLTRACVAVYIRQPPSRERELLDLRDGEPLRYDERLAEFLGIEDTSPAGIVRGVFGGEELAVEHLQRLAAWMRNPSIAIDGELPEEAPDVR